jgi:hypothetical protein
MTILASSASLAAQALILIALPSGEAPPARAQSSMEIPVDELKDLYLSCERAALTGDLGTDDVMQCSLIYEQLKQRAFENDFQSIRDWTDSQLRRRNVADQRLDDFPPGTALSKP